MRIPTFVLEGRQLPRIIFSLKLAPPHDPQKTFSLLKKAYEMGMGCLDLPSSRHLQSFRELKNLTEDEALIGFGHVGAEEGASFSGAPLHRFESKVISTVKKNLFPPQFIQSLKRGGFWNEHDFFTDPFSPDVFTQKDIDRISYDPPRLNKALSPFRFEESPFLVLGGKYTDWLLCLGRTDLIEKMALGIREKGFIPIFSGQWATFILPKVKSMDWAAYGIPISRSKGLFDLARAYALVKKFDKPLISLSPLADGNLLESAEDTFSFLFKELRIHGTIAEIDSEEDARTIVGALEKYPSLISPRKT